MRRFFVAVLLFLTAFVPRTIAEGEFKTDYAVDYFVTAQGSDITTDVAFTTTITNLKNDIYVDRYQLAFPATFQISNITASDDHGSITPSVEQDEENTYIDMQFSDPNIGLNTKNILTLNFNQDKLFRANGNVWEVILPTIDGREQGGYSVRVHLPPTDKTISIAKPPPTRVEGDVIYWDNPSVKTIYAVFGDTQYYELDLVYHLANEKVAPVYTEIAFPPDTLYQQILVESIKPEPASVRLDEDGNYLARYDLNPREEKEVRFRGYAQIFTEPRDEVRAVTAERFEAQKKYLRNETEFWSVADKASYGHLTSPEAVFKSVVGAFSYDYERLENNASYRLGAQTALENPTKAVCVEFTDTFIALARANGMYAREIQGYGFSQDERLRPLSLITDVLHSWPEYYDTESGLWKQVDPTWENTSGIDYFSSFDLDHIAFAIHGKDPEHPPPAGTYKLEDSRDVSVKAIPRIPEEKLSLGARNLDLKRSVSDNQTYTGSVEIVNEGNTTVYDIPVVFKSSGFTVEPKETTVAGIPPRGAQKLAFTYKQKAGSTAKTGSITVSIDGQDTVSRTVRVTPMVQTVTVTISAIVAVILLILLLVFVRRRRRHI